MKAMLSNKIGEQYSEKLKGWWEKFGKAMEDNELTEAERNALTDVYKRQPLADRQGSPGPWFHRRHL